MDRVKSAAEMVQEMERRINVMEKGIQELKLLVKGFGDHILADDIIAGVKAKADDAGDGDEQEANTATLRIESARADNKPVADAQAVVSVGKRKETKQEVFSPLDMVCREIGSLATAQLTFSAVVEGLWQIEQLLTKQDIKPLTDLMDGISGLFSVHGRTLSRDTRRFLMDRTRDIVYVLVEEYANLMKRGSCKEANTIRQAMKMMGVVRLEKMIEEKDLPPTVIEHMERLSLSFVGQKKATQLLDALEGDDVEEEEETARGKLLLYAQLIEEAQTETIKASRSYGLGRQGCINRSRMLVRQAKEMAFTPCDMKSIEIMIVEDRLPSEVCDRMDEEAHEIMAAAEGGNKARTLLYSLVGTILRLNPKRRSDEQKDAAEEVSVMDDPEKARRRTERERKGKERAERDRVYRNEMRGSNASPPKHGKR